MRTSLTRAPSRSGQSGQSRDSLSSQKARETCAVPTVPPVPTGLDKPCARAGARACVCAHTRSVFGVGTVGTVGTPYLSLGFLGGSLSRLCPDLTAPVGTPPAFLGEIESGHPGERAFGGAA